MSLYKQWKALAEKERTEEEYESYWKTYFAKEKENYEYILKNHDEVISGKLSELAEKFNMDSITMVGFIDGINSSLTKSIKLEEIEETTDIQFILDFEKLYFNMLDAKADWLYNLPEWDEVLDMEKENKLQRISKSLR